MKKLLALLLALLMALSCTLAVAEEPVVEEPSFTLPAMNIPALTIESELRVDEEMVVALLGLAGLDENVSGIVQQVLPVINNVSEKISLAENGVQYDVLLKGGPVLSAAVRENEGLFEAVTNILPSYKITVSQETLQKMVEEIVAKVKEFIGDVDVNAIVSHIMEYANEFIQKATAAVTVGEAEVGEYEYEGIVFTAKTPISVDMPALAEAYKTYMQQIMTEENIQKLIAKLNDLAKSGQLGDNIEINLDDLMDQEKINEGLDKVLEVMAKAEMSGNLYTVEESEDAWVEMTIDMKDEEIGVMTENVLSANGVVKTTVDVPAQNVNVVVTVSLADLSLRMDVNAQGMYLGFAANIALADDLKAECDVYFMNPEKALAHGTLTVTQGAEITMDFDDENKTAITVEELMSGDAQSVLEALQQDITVNGLGVVLGNAMQQMPQEIGNLMGTIMGGAMNAEEGAVESVEEITETVEQ